MRFLFRSEQCVTMTDFCCIGIQVPVFPLFALVMSMALGSIVELLVFFLLSRVQYDQLCHTYGNWLLGTMTLVCIMTIPIGSMGVVQRSASPKHCALADLVVCLSSWLEKSFQHCWCSLRAPAPMPWLSPSPAGVSSVQILSGDHIKQSQRASSKCCSLNWQRVASWRSSVAKLEILLAGFGPTCRTQTSLLLQ